MFWELSRRFINEALDLCDETADWPDDSKMRWTCEVTAPVVDWIRHSSDRQIERFTNATQRGQIATGAMFCNLTPNYNLEQFAQSLLPVRELREQFGLPISVAINHDVNGLPWSFVPLLIDAGITLEHLKPAQDASGIIARLVNHRGRSAKVLLELPELQIEAAHLCSTLEEPIRELGVRENLIHMEMAPRAVATIQINV